MIKVYLVILGWIQGLKGLKKTLVVQILSILIIILWHDFSHRSWIGFIEAYHQPFTSLSHWTRSMVHGRKTEFCNLVGLCGCRTKLKKIDINLKSEQQKTAHIQKLAINKNSTNFVQSFWNLVKIITSWGNHFPQVSWWLDKNFGFFINVHFLNVCCFLLLRP